MCDKNPLERLLLDSRLGDKCDRSMTLGKLLDNNAQFFIFIFLKPVTELKFLQFV